MSALALVCRKEIYLPGAVYKPKLKGFLSNYSPAILTITINQYLKWSSWYLFDIEMVPQEAKVPWDSDSLSDLVLVGNLPFNVATPFFLKLVKSLEERCNYYTFGKVSAVFTFQNEVRCIDNKF